MNKYYIVYGLIDGRNGKLFYVGKGTLLRMLSHKSTNKDAVGKKMKEIEDDKSHTIKRVMIDNLTEAEAIKNEALIISTLGTLKTGGILINKNTPTGHTVAKPSSINIPPGLLEKASIAKDLIEGVVYDFVEYNNSVGVTNAQIAKYLGLTSSYMDNHENYLTHSILGNLMNQNKILKRNKKYFIK